MEEPNTTSNPAKAESEWRSLYTAGGVAAVVLVAGALLDIALTMAPGWGPGSVPPDVRGWFAQLAGQPLVGLRNLDLLNAVLSTVGLPMYGALYVAHRRSAAGPAFIALLFAVAGATLFTAANAALPMLELARAHASVAAPEEKAALEAAGAALLARGAHGGFGAFPGFFVSEIGALLMALAMLRGRVFGRLVAWTGVIGSAIMTGYSVAITFEPTSSTLVTMAAVPAALLLLAWEVAAASTLLKLGHGAVGATAA